MPSYSTNTPSNVSVSAATAKTVLAVVTPSTRRVRIRELSVGAQSTTSTDAPMLVELVQFDTDGTGTAVTPTPDDPAETAALSSGKHSYSAEPTTNAVVKKHWLVPVQSAIVQQEFVDSMIVVPASKVLGIRVTAPQAQNIRAYLEFDE